jgi:hypothetical protein
MNGARRTSGQAPYQSGREAFLSGKSVGDCPWPPGSKSWTHWLLGYDSVRPSARLVGPSAEPNLENLIAVIDEMSAAGSLLIKLGGDVCQATLIVGARVWTCEGPNRGSVLFGVYRRWKGL